MTHTVTLDRQRDGHKVQWRATIVVPPERRVHGYGPNIPAALAQLSRALERHAVNLFDVLLSEEPPPAAEVSPGAVGEPRGGGE